MESQQNFTQLSKKLFKIIDIERIVQTFYEASTPIPNGKTVHKNQVDREGKLGISSSANQSLQFQSQIKTSIEKQTSNQHGSSASPGSMLILVQIPPIFIIHIFEHSISILICSSGKRQSRRAKSFLNCPLPENHFLF